MTEESNPDIKKESGDMYDFMIRYDTLPFEGQIYSDYVPKGLSKFYQVPSYCPSNGCQDCYQCTFSSAVGGFTCQPSSNYDQCSCEINGNIWVCTGNLKNNSIAKNSSCYCKEPCTLEPYPDLECWQNATWDNINCSWIITGDPLQGGCCPGDTPNECGVCDGSIVKDDCGICGGNGVSGCTNPTACNYNPLATCDDGTCVGIQPGKCDCQGNVLDACGDCGGNGVSGCTNPTACNYNPLATCDDGSCNFIAPGACDCNGNAVGHACEDGDPCTINDTIDSNCQCTGTPKDYPNPSQSYDSVCIDDAAFTIQVDSTGGTFSGTGIHNGLFSPQVAGIGSHTILYDYDSQGCNQQIEIEITVVDCPTDIPGCMDPLAQNYNPDATVSDNSCKYCSDFTIQSMSVSLCAGESVSQDLIPSRGIESLEITDSEGNVISNSETIDWTAPSDPNFGDIEVIHITATDSFGCVATSFVRFHYIPIPQVSVTSSNGACASEPSITVSLDRDYGNDALVISLDGGNTFITIQKDESGNFVLPISTSGTYTPLVSWSELDEHTECFAPTFDAMTIDTDESNCDSQECMKPIINSLLPLNNINDCTLGRIVIGAEDFNNQVDVEYSINGISWQTNNVFSNLPIGDYTVYTRNPETGCEDSGEVTIDEIECDTLCEVRTITYVTTVVDSCVGINTGCINFGLGVTNYEYSIDGITYQSDTSFCGLAPGVYQIFTRRNDDKCGIFTNATIEAINSCKGCTDSLAHNFSNSAIDDDGSCETCFDGIRNGDELAIDCGGALCIPCIIGCQDSMALTYNPVAQINSSDSCIHCEDFTLEIAFEKDSLCIHDELEPNFSLTPANEDFSISWHVLGPLYNSYGSLIPGEHIVRAVAINMAGCIITEQTSFFVKENPQIEIIGPDSICYGDTVELMVIGGIASEAEIFWNDGTSDQSTSVVAGTDINVSVYQDGCVFTSDFDVKPTNCDSCTLDIVELIAEAGCNNGLIITAIHNSNEPLNYTWGDGSSEPSYTLSGESGLYFVTLELNDSRGCTATLSKEFSISNNDLNPFNGNTRICYGDSSQISIGGTTDDASITWSTGQVDDNIYVYPDQTYAVTIIESGCQIIDSFHTEGVTCDTTCRSQVLNFEIQDGRIRVGEGSNIDIGRAAPNEINLTSTNGVNFEYQLTIDNNDLTALGFGISITSTGESQIVFDENTANNPLPCFRPLEGTPEGVLIIKVVDGILVIYNSDHVFVHTEIDVLGDAYLSLLGDFSTNLTGTLVEISDGCPAPISNEIPTSICPSTSEPPVIECQVLSHDDGTGSGEILVNVNSADTFHTIEVNGVPTDLQGTGYLLLKNLRCGSYSFSLDSILVSCDTEILSSNTSDTIYIEAGECIDIDFSNDCFSDEFNGFCIAWEPNDDIDNPQSSITEICPTTDTCYLMQVISDDGNITQTKEICVIIDTLCGLDVNVVQTSDCNSPYPFINLDISGNNGPVSVFVNGESKELLYGTTLFTDYGEHQIYIIDSSGCSQVLYVDLLHERPSFTVNTSWGTGHDYRYINVTITDQQGFTIYGSDRDSYSVIVEHHPLGGGSSEVFRGDILELNRRYFFEFGFYSITVTGPNGCSSSQSIYQGICTYGYYDRIAQCDEEIEVDIVHIDYSSGILGSASIDVNPYTHVRWLSSGVEIDGDDHFPTFSGDAIDNITRPGKWVLEVNDHASCKRYTQEVIIECTTTFVLNEVLSIDNGTSCISDPDQTLTLTLSNISGVNPAQSVTLIGAGNSVSTEVFNGEVVFANVSYGSGNWIVEIEDVLGCKMSYPIQSIKDVVGVGLTSATKPCEGRANGSVTFTITNPGRDAVYYYLDETNGLFLGRGEEISYTLESLTDGTNYSAKFKIGDCIIERQFRLGARSVDKVLSRGEGIHCYYDYYCDEILIASEAESRLNRSCDFDNVDEGSVWDDIISIFGVGKCCTYCESCDEDESGYAIKQCEDYLHLFGPEAVAVVNEAFNQGRFGIEYRDLLLGAIKTGRCQINAICPINWTMNSWRVNGRCLSTWDPCDFLQRAGLEVGPDCQNICRSTTASLYDYIDNHDEYLSTKDGYAGSDLASFIQSEYLDADASGEPKWTQHTYWDLPHIRCAKVSFCPDDYSSPSVSMKEYYCQDQCFSSLSAVAGAGGQNCRVTVVGSNDETENDCQDKVDNDADGYTDCQDIDCFGSIYLNNFKNDQSKKMDCPLFNQDEVCSIDANLNFFKDSLGMGTIKEVRDFLDATHLLINTIQPAFLCDGNEVLFDYYGYGGLLYCENGLWVYMRESNEIDVYNYWRFEHPSEGGCQRWTNYDPPTIQKLTFYEAVFEVLTATFSSVGHTSLDVIGMHPQYGPAADALNAMWYVAEGDYSNGALSMVAIVFNGATVSRVLKVIIDPVSDAIQFTLKMEINGNLVTFGSKNALRDGMKHFGIDLTGRIAHHMIPHEFWDNPLVQQAAKYFKNPFHINDPLANGFPILKELHRGFSNSHRDYNDMIRELLTELYGYLGEEGILNPKNAAKVLEALQDLLKRELEKLERLHSQGGNVSLSDINIDIMEILDLAGL